MKNTKLLELNYKLLLELEEVLKEYYGEKCEVKITKGDDIFTLCTDSYILSFPFEPFHFYLSFMVGQTAQKISENTKLIMTIFEFNEFTVIEDSYFDNESDKLVFGMDALAIKQKEILDEQGKTKCNICDRIFMVDHITEKGICKYCNMDDILWN